MTNQTDAERLAEIRRSIGWGTVPEQESWWETARFLLRLLDAATSRQEGAPREPTEAMVAAGRKAKKAGMLMEGIWAAMYDADPTHPSAPSEAQAHEVPAPAATTSEGCAPERTQSGVSHVQRPSEREHHPSEAQVEAVADDSCEVSEIRTVSITIDGRTFTDPNDLARAYCEMRAASAAIGQGKDEDIAALREARDMLRAVHIDEDAPEYRATWDKCLAKIERAVSRHASRQAGKR